jgi:MazG family protein
MANMQALLDLMAQLRDGKAGCNWCREQTFASISAYTLEEAFEVADAIATGDREALRDELGDLLLQVVFHARMAEEEGSFGFTDVVEAIHSKLVRRHPQLFAGDTDYSANAADWEAIKRAERAAKGEVRASLMDGVPRGAPALLKAQKLQQKAALVGFDWPDAQSVLGKLDEEVTELKEAVAQQDENAMADELGDVLFTLVNLARHLSGGNAEQSLRLACAKFERRFRQMEANSSKPLGDLAAVELESLWQQAKLVQG